MSVPGHSKPKANRPHFIDLPDEAFVMASQICRKRGGFGIVPMGRTKWKALWGKGAAPAPEYPFGGAVPLWRVGVIREYLRNLGTPEAK
jgi:hypothetical protein